MKSIRGEIGWARAAPIHAHTPRPRVPALIRVNSKSEVGLTYTRLTGMELCHCSFPVASAASRASLMRFSTWSNREKRTTPVTRRRNCCSHKSGRGRGRCFVHRLAPRRFIYVCLRRKKLVKEYTRPNISRVYNGVERLSKWKSIVKNDDRSSIGAR